MNDNIPYDLITKFLAGECSKEEKIKIEDWKHLNIENLDVFNQLKLTWSETEAPEYNVNVDDALGKVTKRLGEQYKSKFPFVKIALSAAAGIVIALGVFGLLRNEILPPKEIVLASLINDKPKEYILPDGSKITLNSGSTLAYPKKFSNYERRVVFSGEAYFDIASNKEKPFIIESGNTEAKVLGTEFNLKSHADSMVQITVTEGLVSLSLKEEPSKGVFLEAGQVGEYSILTDELEKHENKDLNFLAWKNGKLQFINQDLKTAISQISKYYKVEFEIENSALGSIEFTATFDSLSLEEVKSNLELILDVSISDEGGKFILVQNTL